VASERTITTAAVPLVEAHPVLQESQQVATCQAMKAKNLVAPVVTHNLHQQMQVKVKINNRGSPKLRWTRLSKAKSVHTQPSRIRRHWRV